MIPNEENRALFMATDVAHCWHPFTPMSVYADESPLMIESARGHELFDCDGRSFLDGVSSLWCNLLGHQHPKITSAIKNQLDKVAHTTFLGNSNPLAVTLAQRLIALAPHGLSRVFYSDNGSTAVEVALKMALQYHQQSEEVEGHKRTRFLSLGLAYHGDTMGSVSLGGIGGIHDRFQALRFDVVRGPSPYCYRCPLGEDPISCHNDCTQEVVDLIEENASTLAGVVIEPGFQGAAGIITYPEGFLKQVERATKKAGALLIFDEVASGMGRSGDLFVAKTEGISPDLLCLAKGLTGGYLPMAVTLAKEKTYRAFLGRPAEGRTFFHGHTFTGNQLAAAAALATLSTIAEEGVLENVRALKETLTKQLLDLRDHPLVGEIRQYGLAVGIEIVACKTTKKPFPVSERVGMKICRYAQDKNVFLRPLGDVIVLMPAINFSTRDLQRLVSAVKYGVNTLWEEHQDTEARQNP